MQNEERINTPKVYALLLESKETVFLSVQYTYSLEEAFLLAKLEFEKQNPHRVGANNPLVGSKIGLFTIKSVEELTSTLFGGEDTLSKKILTRIDELKKEMDPIVGGINKHMAEIADNQVAEEIPEAPVNPQKKVKKPSKNDLMAQIIQTKDREMFELNKRLFTKAERLYLKERLK